jgi:hypothetical protein
LHILILRKSWNGRLLSDLAGFNSLLLPKNILLG